MGRINATSGIVEEPLGSNNGDVCGAPDVWVAVAALNLELCADPVFALNGQGWPLDLHWLP